MNKHPVINGMVAFLYVIVVVFVMNLGTELMSGQSSYMAPVAVISLFTLSAAVMGYLFVFHPAELYLNEKRKEAVKYFLNTVFTFGVLTGLVLALMFAGVFS